MTVETATEQRRSERECIHRRQGTEGEFYRGDTYVEALQRLRSTAALKMAGQVEAFFWSDALRLRIWLCRGCAAEVGLRRN